MELTPAPPPDAFRASLAVTYDNVAAQREHQGEADWRWPVAERFFAMMQAEGKQRLLEIGAGVGYTSRWFADQGLDVVATDLSPQQVAHCREKGLEAHVRDMYDLGFPSQSFDAVWAMNCIHHVPTEDLDAVLEGICDVMVPGGLFYLGVWGGADIAGMYDDDFYRPPRYFAIRSDAELRRRVGEVLTIESFETFVPDVDKDDDGLHMQSLVVRRLA